MKILKVRKSDASGIGKDALQKISKATMELKSAREKVKSVLEPHAIESYEADEFLGDAKIELEKLYDELAELSRILRVGAKLFGFSGYNFR